jgi:hypothetical protein
VDKDDQLDGALSPGWRGSRYKLARWSPAVDAQAWILEFWQIGNWIVGCEVVQTFTLIFAVPKPEVQQLLKSTHLRRYIIAWMVVLSAAFCLATLWTSAQAIRLHDTLANGETALPEAATLWILVAGRVGCIVLLTAVCVFTVFAPKIFETSTESS